MREEAEKFKRRLESACLRKTEVPAKGDGRYEWISRHIDAKVSHQAVQKWFNGSIPSRKMMRPLAKLLGVTEGYLLGTEGSGTEIDRVSELLARDVSAYILIASGALTCAGYRVIAADEGGYDLEGIAGGQKHRFKVVPVDQSTEVSRCHFPELIQEQVTYLGVLFKTGEPVLVFQWDTEHLLKLNKRIRNRHMPVEVKQTKTRTRVTSETQELPLI